MKTTCSFKNTSAVESLCMNGSNVAFNPRNQSHFVAVEGHLHDEPFKKNTHFVVGFTENIVEVEQGEKDVFWKQRVNSGNLIRNLSRIFPEMGCTCAKYKYEGDSILNRAMSRRYNSWDLSCPHFGIRAVASEKITHSK